MYYAGWDGGGTKTAIVCIDAHGEVILREEAGAFNSLGNIDGTTEAAIAESLAIMEKLPGGLAKCAGLCIGGAGISSVKMRHSIDITLRASNFTAPYTVIPDFAAAFYSVFGNRAGVVLLAGTGAVCFGRNTRGETRRIGGWGHLIDDEGSGYAIGRDVLTAVVHALERRDIPTLLTQAVLKEWGITLDKEKRATSIIPEIVNRIYNEQTGKKEIASLAPLCFTTARQGDEKAQAIIKKAGENLFSLLSAMGRALGTTHFGVALMGSVLTKDDMLTNALKKRCALSELRLSFSAPTPDAALGAARKAALG